MLATIAEKYFHTQAPTEIAPEDHRTLGRLFGFPQTAIDAFVRDGWKCCIGKMDLPQEVQDQDYALFLQFALSKDNWRNEIETAQRWYEALLKYAPAILKEYEDAYKAWLAQRGKNRLA